MNQRLDAFRARMGGYAFGGDYNPEQWDRTTWDEDVALMREAGVNLVTVGVFAWASLEPSPDVYTFEWLDELLDLLHANGISVDLATPTAAPPAWLSREHPETMPVTEDGWTFGFGSRLQFDPTNAYYRERAAKITHKLAERYSQHPALAMWHIGNEYGPAAYNESSAAAFRVWLQRKYGDLDALNNAWYGRFWSQTYTDWEQVCPPELPRSWSNPARRLDFMRFTSDALLECYIAERDIVRSYRDDLPVLTNYMRFYKRADYWRWSQEQDAVALDIYPNPGQLDSRISASLNFDLMRSLKGEPWLLMEQAASSVSQWVVNNPKKPGRMRLGSYQAIARGADSVLFFQWRASRGSHERFHSAMLPHSGTNARSWKEIVALGNELPSIAETLGTTSSAKIALYYDWNSWWALTDAHGLPRNDFDYTEMITAYYKPFLDAHHAIDMVNAESDLSGYDLVVVPHAYLVTDRFAAALEEFANAGGTVVMSFFSGVVDANNQVRQPAYPGAFRSLIGAYIDEYWPALEGEQFSVVFADGTTATADWWQDSIHLETATALATYADSDLAGRAAVLENRVGAGRVVYLATRLSDEAYARTVLTAAAEAGIEPVLSGAPDFVEAARRSSDTTGYLFLLNHSATETATLTVPDGGTDLISGVAVTGGQFTLAPLAVAVIASTVDGSRSVKTR